MSDITFEVGENGELLNVYVAGSVLSYIAVTFNIIIFIILFRKNILSPATILMQGLALADGLTAFSSYGLEPLFQRHYQCDDRVTYCWLLYPYCMIYSHVSLSSMAFHTVSVMLTTCLGIQKVIAMLFPIWTKCHLTKKKSVVCCIACFFVSFCIGFPRHFLAKFKIEYYWYMKREACTIQSRSQGILKYSTIHYLLIQTVLLTLCCIIMMICTVYIVYKLVTNKFRGRQTERRRQERRSVLMVVIVLVVFLISEVPKVFVFVLFSVKYLAGAWEWGNEDQFSLWLMDSFERGMAFVLATLYEDTSIKFQTIMFVLEAMKIFTVIGCMSNLIIYIAMSKKLRMEIKSLCKRTMNRSNTVTIEMQ